MTRPFPHMILLAFTLSYWALVSICFTYNRNKTELLRDSRDSVDITYTDVICKTYVKSSYNIYYRNPFLKKNSSNFTTVHSNTGKLSTMGCSYWITHFSSLHNPQGTAFLQLWCTIFRNARKCLWDMQRKNLNNSFAQFCNYSLLYISKLNYIRLRCARKTTLMLSDMRS
jgi:hypothetical protein